MQNELTPSSPDKSLVEPRIVFIGGGNMASALIGGLVGKLTPGAHMHVVDPHVDSLARLAQQYGVSTAEAPDARIAEADVLVLAVKPQVMREVAAQLKSYMRGQLVLSIAAGIRAFDLSRWLGDYPAIVRSMPNTPALVGRGITGLAALQGVSTAQRALADAVMCAVGQTVWLENEALLDPVTAVSGSGPAYVFYFLEAMQQAAEELGLSAEQGRSLAVATFAGAAELAAHAPEPLSVLRERVTSKGGTTHAALTSMAEDKVGAAIVRALHAASARGQAMGEEFGRDE